MDINYELYKVFYYVAKTLSFSEASKCLYISQSAVSSGFFKSSGTSSKSCFALEVRKISLPRFSSIKLENSFSMISALVATVPSPPVSPRVLAMALS